MGQWGHGPFEGDPGYDVFDELFPKSFVDMNVEDSIKFFKDKKNIQRAITIATKTLGTSSTLYGFFTALAVINIFEKYEDMEEVVQNLLNSVNYEEEYSEDEFYFYYGMKAAKIFKKYHEDGKFDTLEKHEDLPYLAFPFITYGLVDYIRGFQPPFDVVKEKIDAVFNSL